MAKKTPMQPTTGRGMLKIGSRRLARGDSIGSIPAPKTGANSKSPGPCGFVPSVSRTAAAHQHPLPEQVALDHQGIEAGYVPLQYGPYSGCGSAGAWVAPCSPLPTC